LKITGPEGQGCLLTQLDPLQLYLPATPAVKLDYGTAALRYGCFPNVMENVPHTSRHTFISILQPNNLSSCRCNLSFGALPVSLHSPETRVYLALKARADFQEFKETQTAL